MSKSNRKKTKEHSCNTRFAFLATLNPLLVPSQKYELHAPDTLFPSYSVYDRHSKCTAGVGDTLLKAIDNAIDNAS